MRRLRIGRRLKVYVEPRDIWVGVYLAPAHVYVLPLPLLVFRWARRNACQHKNHNECTGCPGCYCHRQANNSPPI